MHIALRPLIQHHQVAGAHMIAHLHSESDDMGCQGSCNKKVPPTHQIRMPVPAIEDVISRLAMRTQSRCCAVLRAVLSVRAEMDTEPSGRAPARDVLQV